MIRECRVPDPKMDVPVGPPGFRLLVRKLVQKHPLLLQRFHFLSSHETLLQGVPGIADQVEQDLAQTRGVKIKHWVAPKKVKVKDGQAVGLTCEYMRETKGRLEGTGETFDLPADMIFKAIGQTYVDVLGGALALEAGRIRVDAERRTSLAGIWAGGDCAAGGKDLTVAAVDGRGVH